jgi:predicted nuclease of restriction endonuclease-like RecB superfamily
LTGDIVLDTLYCICLPFKVISHNFLPDFILTEGGAVPYAYVDKFWSKKQHYFRRKFEEIKLRKYSIQNNILFGDLTAVTSIWLT